jgi:hypothetical protein
MEIEDLDDEPEVKIDFEEGIIADDIVNDDDSIDKLDDDISDDDLKADTVSKKDFDELQGKLKKIEDDKRTLTTEKRNLNKALHEARKAKKSTKEDDDEPLTDEQLLKIIKENEGDAETILRVVKHCAERAAKETSGQVVTDSDIQKKSKEAGGILNKLYPSLSDDSSEMRKAVDETKSYYGIDSHPLGDYFATGIQVLQALPDLILAAEKRGKDGALKEKADGKRKETIKDGFSHKKKGSSSSSAGLSTSQSEAAGQLNLSPSQLKTYQKIVGKTASIQVKE